MIRIEIYRSGQDCLTVLRGQLDASGSMETERVLASLIARGDRHLVLDVRDVDFIGRDGISMLLHAARRLKPEGRQMALCGLSRHIEDQLLSSEAPECLVFSESEAEARRHFRARDAAESALHAVTALPAGNSS